MSARDTQSQSQASASGAPLDLSLVREILGATRLGNKFHYFEQIGSTNTHARELAESNAAEGEVVIAESQTHGRGRLGRRWESPPWTNLYFSIVLRPKLAPQHAAQITLMAAVGVAEAVASFITQEITIKWPNDILVDGRKLAGILTEACCNAGRVEYVILGVGINVNTAIDSMPADIRRHATSLFDLTGKNVPRENVLHRLIRDLDRCYGVLEASGFHALRPRWEARFNLRGKRVRAELNGQVVTGRACGIDRSGALVLEDENGMLKTIIAGDVIPLER
jgi:BirA family biotin operon repressor/biotin-[acetyl-CoA-carboxylase] ligase